ncbi:chorion peroxidase-like [Gordionus sp. m RMFG-2023]|uniref:chorion peroxidase-like n=1 Tax=Gordionus sp. m RMFG-2023 TaxID=3053472 RepID=UPI0031FDB1D2
MYKPQRDLKGNQVIHSFKEVWLVYSQPNLQPLPISPFFSPPFGQIPLVNPFLSIGFSENLNPLIGHPDSLSIGPPFYVFDNFIDQDKCSDIDQGCACLSEYRTFDGTCNNVKHSKFGSTFQPLLRILSPNYGDGKSSFRRSQSGSPLPNARKISLLIHGLPDMLNEFLSIIAMQWGQMVDHEMNFVPATKKPDGSRLACCGADSSNTQCAHIDVKGDPFYGEFEVVCIGFTRSEISNISSRSREQFNKVTSYIDGSVIYGSDEAKAKSLRSFKNGMLLMTQSPVPGGKSMLLLVKDAKLCDGQEKNGTGICTAADRLHTNLSQKIKRCNRLQSHPRRRYRRTTQAVMMTRQDKKSKRLATTAVARAKSMAYDDMYEDTD